MSTTAPTEYAGQPPTPKRPLYKRAWFWVVLILGAMLLLFVGCTALVVRVASTASDDAAVSAASESAQDPVESTPQQSAPAESAPPAEPPSEAPIEPAPPAEPEGTVSQLNALESAQSYLDMSGFSRLGLIQQLEFEGFTTEDATWAVDTVGADWNAQAARSAQQYLDTSSFSRSGLVEQLQFEGFEAEQAEHGATAVGL